MPMLPGSPTAMDAISNTYAPMAKMAAAAPPGGAAPGGDPTAGLSKQEKNLYTHQLENPPKAAPPDGSGGVFMTVVQLPNGKWAAIPTVWGGKVLNEAKALDKARADGLAKWPQYATRQEAEAAFMAITSLLQQPPDTPDVPSGPPPGPAAGLGGPPPPPPGLM